MAKNKLSRDNIHFDVAIIGMSCRFPGANRYRYFWENLINEVNSITEIPDDRWSIEEFYSEDFSEPGKSISKWGGFLDNISHFDNRFFDTSPREARNMDPQQRLLLEETWHCIEDSGISLINLSNKMVSVYVGVMAMDYYHTSLAPNVITDSFSAAGNYGCILANRLSYYYGFKGVSKTIDTACSSSLVAINSARRNLLLGESDYCLVAGVNLSYSPFKYISFSKSRMLSPDGQCKTFDKDANGYVPGEGVAVLLLQPLENAEEEGNYIYGVIRGSSVNHVGRSISMTAPRVESQRDVLVAAFENSNVDPSTIGYIEAHGTGTSLGDPIEIDALTRAFQKYTNKMKFCYVGSVKTNLGHLEAAAGMAGLIKVLLMFKNKKIPKTLNVKVPNPIINFDRSPFKLANELIDWKPIGNSPRRAGVSSFGFGGVNAHAIIDEYVSTDQEEEIDSSLEGGVNIAGKKGSIFILSAKNHTSLQGILGSWFKFVETEDYEKRLNLEGICHTLKKGREIFPKRFGALVNSKEELTQIIKENNDPKHLYSKSEKFQAYRSCTEKNLVFRIGDLSELDLSHAHGLYMNDSEYQESFNKCKTIISEITFSFSNVLQEDPNAQQRYQRLYIFSIVYCLVKRIIHCNANPYSICGEKLGQWVAITISGAISLKNTLSGILNEEYLKEIHFQRPTIPLYMQSLDSTIHPFYFDEDYKRHLIKDVEVSDQIVETHIRKANLLVTSQLTFKKLIESWDSCFLPEEYGVNEMLNEEGWWKRDDTEETEAHKVLILIIILSCLRSLNRKWNLIEHLPQISLGAKELLDLISDNLITQAEVIQLFKPGFSEFAKLADQVHARQTGLDLSKPYDYLRERSTHIQEVKDNQELIFQIGTKNLPALKFANSLTLDVGMLAHPSKEMNHCNLPLSQNLSRNLAQSVLDLWLRGIDINWEKYSPTTPNQKRASTPLPVYVFHRKRFWIDSSNAGLSSRRMLNSSVSKSSLKKVLPLTNKTNSFSQRNLFFQTTWSLSPFFQGKQISPDSLNLIFVNSDKELGGCLSQLLQQFNTQVIWLTHGRKYFQIDDLTYQLNFLEEESFSLFFQNLEENFLKEEIRELNIFYLLAYEKQSVSPQSFEKLKRGQEERVYPFLFLSKALSKSYFEGQVNISIITNDAYIVSNELDEGDGYAYGALSGMAKTYMIENKNVLVKQFDFSSSDQLSPTEVSEIILSERQKMKKEQEVAIREGKKWVRMIQPAPLNRSLGTGLLEKKGVYIILGGLGKIGLQIANYFVKTTKVRLVLVGRSALDSQKKKFIQSLENQGSEVIYLQANICELNQMTTMIQKVKKTYGKINGVIHSAGITSDKPILTKDLDSFRQVVETKTLGTWILDSVTQNENLDFFILFSSVVSILGNYGQVDFSAGNSFIDAFVHYRRQREGGHTLGINWTLWTDGEQEENQQAIQQLESMGVETIQSTKAVEAFELILKNQIPQVIVISKNHDQINWPYREILESNIGDENQVKPLLRKTLEIKMKQQIENDLIEMVGKQLSVNVNGLDTHELLLDIGVDLIGANEIAILLRHRYSFLFEHSFIESPRELLSLSIENLVMELIKVKLEYEGKPNELILEEKEKKLKQDQNQELMDRYLTQLITKKLEFSEGEVDLDESFFSLGIESILVQEITAELLHFYPEITPTTVFEYPNINDLGRHLLSLKKELPPFFEGETPMLETEIRVPEIEVATTEIETTAEIETTTLKVEATVSEIEAKVSEVEAKVSEVEATVSEAEATVSEAEATVFEIAATVSETEATVFEVAATVPETEATVSEIEALNVLEDGEVIGKKKYLGYGIAVIGMSGKFPQASDVNELWDNLVQEKDCIEEIPKERWDYTPYYDSDKKNTSKTYGKWGGFIKDVDKFDALFFNISPREAEQMDPQQRLFLESVWETLEDAGYGNTKPLRRKKVGVFVGMMWNEYSLFSHELGFMQDRYGGPGSLYWYIPNRVSYFFDYTGPCMAIDTACSSSLSCVHMACQSILSGESELAIAGGVNLTIHPGKYLYLARGRFLAEDGKCRSFGEGGSGYVPGEGIASVLLKPIEKAIQDGDPIHGIIRGTAINHGGKATGFTVPSPDAQCEVILMALKKARVNPRDIGYMECHGTGTPLGDPIEIKGLTKAFRNYTEDKQFCAIGSIKSNIGHLEGAAGIAGMIKVLLCLGRKKIPKSLHSQKINPNLVFETTPFYVSQSLQKWERRNGKPRIASLSSFGAGGSNSHAIFEEYREKPIELEYTSKHSTQILIFSAQNRKILEKYIQHFIGYFEKTLPEKESLPNLENVAFTLQIGRTEFVNRLAVVSGNYGDLLLTLKDFIAGKENIANCFHGKTSGKRKKRGEEQDAEKVLMLLQNKDLSKIAELWIQGEEIGWELLHNNRILKRISLPSYPFEGQRCWLFSNENDPLFSPSFQRHHLSNATSSGNIALHSLIDLKVPTTGVEDEFKKVFSEEDFFTRDCTIFGERIFPRVAHLEMARAAGNLASEKRLRVQKIQNVMWIETLALEREKVEAWIRLISEETEVAQFEIFTRDGDLEKTHSVGQILYTDKATSSIAKKIEIEDILSRCVQEKITEEEMYQSFEKVGLDFKNSFRCISKCYTNSFEFLALLELPNSSQGKLIDDLLHPALLDCIIQAPLLWNQNQELNKNKLYLPLTLNEIEIFWPLEKICYLHVTLSEGEQEEAFINYDVQIYDQTGNLLAQIQRISLSLIEESDRKGTSSGEKVNQELSVLLEKLKADEISVEEALQITSSINGYD